MNEKNFCHFIYNQSMLDEVSGFGYKKAHKKESFRFRFQSADRREVNRLAQKAVAL